MDTEQLTKIHTGTGFIAALDQSGGSTPRALQFYGVDDDAYANLEAMFDLVHEMRERIITSPVFTGEHILGTILFGMTMDRDIGGKGAAEYLWEDKGIVPFLKVDAGLLHEEDGARLMKPMPDLDKDLEAAKEHGVFGTKMRSLIRLANPAGVQAVVDQQFEVARHILDAGLVPILEPEIDINSHEKQEAELLLKGALMSGLDSLSLGQQVLLKLTLPEQENLHADLVAHPNVMRVFALSGGYSREEANARLARNTGVAASFSRALTEGLNVDQSEAEFNAVLKASITSIYEASLT
jgi:fructose-bisphosphate aldolase, class I